MTADRSQASVPEPFAAHQLRDVPQRPWGAGLAAQHAADGVGVVEEAPQHRQVGSPVLGPAERLRRGGRVAVHQEHTAVVGDGAGDEAVAVAVLQAVAVQVLAEDGVGPSGHEQRVPGGVGVVQVSGQGAFLGGDEAAQPVALFQQGHRPAVLGQFGGGDQAVHTGTDDDDVDRACHHCSSDASLREAAPREPAGATSPCGHGPACARGGTPARRAGHARPPPVRSRRGWRPRGRRFVGRDHALRSTCRTDAPRPSTPLLSTAGVPDAHIPTATSVAPLQPWPGPANRPLRWRASARPATACGGGPVIKGGFDAD